MGVYRKGNIHVLSEMCATCIFRPGNLMQLREGRVSGMVQDAQRNQGCIPCHETLGRKAAVCAGFFRQYATQPLQIADRLGHIVFDKPPEPPKAGGGR